MEIFANPKLLKGPLSMNGKLSKGNKKLFSVDFNPGVSTTLSDAQYKYLIEEDTSILQVLLDQGALIVEATAAKKEKANNAADDVQKAQAALLDAEDKLQVAPKDKQKDAKAKVTSAKKVLTEAKKAAKGAGK